jgi:hypothetical protein
MEDYMLHLHTEIAEGNGRRNKKTGFEMMTVEVGAGKELEVTWVRCQ